MASIDFPLLFQTLKTGVTDLVKGTVTDYAKQAEEEASNALDLMKDDIEEWSKEVAEGNMGIDDLQFLIEGKKELMEMKKLEEIGVAQIELEQFRNALIDLVVSNISKVIK